MVRNRKVSMSRTWISLVANKKAWERERLRTSTISKASPSRCDRDKPPPPHPHQQESILEHKKSGPKLFN